MLDKEIDAEAIAATPLWCIERETLVEDLLTRGFGLVDDGVRVSVRPTSLLAQLLPGSPSQGACQAGIPEDWAGERVEIDGWAVCAVLTDEELELYRYFSPDTGGISAVDTLINAIVRAVPDCRHVVFITSKITGETGGRTAVLAREF